MKKRGVGILLLLLALFVSASTWEGSAVVGGLGDFPTEGLYGACNSFPRDSLVQLKNLENGKTAEVRISGGVDNPGVFMALSPKAAQELGMKAGSAARVRAIVLPQPSVPLALPLPPSTGESSDPDFNPRLLAARGKAPTATGPVAATVPAPKPAESTPVTAPKPAETPTLAPLLSSPLVAEPAPLPKPELAAEPPLPTETAQATAPEIAAVPETAAAPEPLVAPETAAAPEPVVASEPEAAPLPETAALIGGELPSLPSAETPAPELAELPSTEAPPAELAELPKPAEEAAPESIAAEESAILLGGENPPAREPTLPPELELAEAEPQTAEEPALSAASAPAAEAGAETPAEAAAEAPALPEIAELSPEPPQAAEPASPAEPELAEAPAPSLPEAESALVLGGEAPLPAEAAAPESELAEAEILPEAPLEAAPEPGLAEGPVETELSLALEATGPRPPLASAESASAVPEAPALPSAASPSLDALPASGGPPLLERLAPGSYYVQVAVFGNNEALGKAASGLGALPLAAERIEGRSGSLYRLYVGPLGRDEGGALLIKIRSLGFKDAFIKRGG